MADVDTPPTQGIAGGPALGGFYINGVWYVSSADYNAQMTAAGLVPGVSAPADPNANAVSLPPIPPSTGA